MELTLWTYEGPPHVGAMRIAASMQGVHYVLHAPQGDTYADLLFTMIERRDQRPPVTYTTFQARDLGGDTAELVKRSIRDAAERFQPQALLVGESCTAELIQDQPGALAQGMNLPMPVVTLELPAYSKKENWGAAETLYQLIRTLLKPQLPPAGLTKPDPKRWQEQGRRPRVNLLGPSLLGFRCRDDVREVRVLLDELGIDTHVVAPLGASPEDLRRIPQAEANICLYPEIADSSCRWLERQFGMPTVSTVPIGIGATEAFCGELQELLGLEPTTNGNGHSRMPWYSRSVDSTYLTGKRVFIFADATHAIAAARIASRELGFEVVGLGCFNREYARDIRVLAKDFGVEPLISDDYLEVEKRIQSLQPELILGTQMERHIGKRLGIPCAVISAPFHVQDNPARYSPQVGWEGANVIFDTWVHPLVMGLEEHLLHMFRDDFEFHDEAGPSHHGGHLVSKKPKASLVEEKDNEGSESRPIATPDEGIIWLNDAEKELKKIPFFVRGKARRNTELYAVSRGVSEITVDTLYEAKAHYAN